MIKCIEKMKGSIKLTNLNLFLEDTTDISSIEFWEDRLDKLGEPYAVTFRTKKGKIMYSLYCNTKRVGSSFKEA